MYNFNDFLLSESIKFDKLPKKKGAKTEVYDVIKDDETIGQVKWSSRVMGYAFQPTATDDDGDSMCFPRLLVKASDLTTPLLGFAGVI